MHPTQISRVTSFFSISPRIETVKRIGEASMEQGSQDRALHLLLKDQVTLAPDAKHQLWSVYE